LSRVGEVWAFVFEGRPFRTWLLLRELSAKRYDAIDLLTGYQTEVYPDFAVWKNSRDWTRLA
jgi:hypothetical protein